MTAVEEDPEKAKPRNDGYGGYDRLARLMGHVPDVAIFRRFAHLSAESLLHYQAELYEHELRLAQLKERDSGAKAGTDRTRYNFNSQYLRDSVLEDEEGEEGYNDPEQWETMVRIRELLKEYYAALIAHQQIVNLNKPHHGQLDELREWMRRGDMGNMNLTGEDDDIWKVSTLDELITMERSTLDGVSSSRSTVTLVKLYHDLVGRHMHREEKSDHLRNSILYRDDGVIKVIRTAKTLAACMLPVVGIAVLYAVKDMSARIGIVAGFTAIFSLNLCFFTSASVKDIFGATAAFSAVLVVFVGATE